MSILASFASLNDLSNANVSSPTGYTQIDVAPNYQIAGVTWDGTAYRALLESRADATAPFDVYLASFASLNDLSNANISSPTGYTQIDVAPNYQIAGLTWDGSAYRVLLESRADATAPFDVYLASFASLNDLSNASTSSPTGYTQIDVAPNYQIAGLTWDGSAYRVLLESRADATAPSMFIWLRSLRSTTCLTPTQARRPAIPRSMLRPTTRLSAFRR